MASPCRKNLAVQVDRHDRGGLDALFIDDPNVFVAGDLLWYPVEGKPNIRIAPDVMVVFGRPKGDEARTSSGRKTGSRLRSSSRSSRPAIALERWNANSNSMSVMALRSITSTTQTAVIWLVGSGAGNILEEIPKMAGFESPRLKIRFEPGEGPNNLKIIGPDGEPFLTYAEVVKQRKADRQRADEQSQRADEQSQRADEQTQRADRLAARLRELGIEPD